MSLFHEDSAELFKGHHFNSEIITLCVRWYVTYKLSYRDLAEMMAERHVDVAHTTIMRWVQRYVPEFAKRWQRFPRSVGTSWRIDETYIRFKGKWAYLYRAVDREGQTVHFFLSEHRDIAAAKRFFAAGDREARRAREDHPRWICRLPCRSGRTPGGKDLARDSLSGRTAI